MRTGLVTPQVESGHRDEPLIVLDSSSSSSDQVSSTSSLESRSVDHFDPLNNSHYSSLQGSSSTVNAAAPGCRASGSVPVPRPRITKQRLNHVEKVQNGSTVSGSSTMSSGGVSKCDAAPRDISAAARAMFIQSAAPATVSVIPPRKSSLDQFDPLASGQLAVDNLTHSDHAAVEEEDDNLLKEWSLDFPSLTIGGSTSGGTGQTVMAAPRGGAVTLLSQPAINSLSYVSMPNLTRPDASSMGYRAPTAFRPSVPWMMGPSSMVLPQRGSSNIMGVPARHPPAPQLSSNRCATLPGGFETFTQSTSQIQAAQRSNLDDLLLNPAGPTDSVLHRPHSMDLEGLFTNPLPASNLPPAPSRHSTCPTWEKFD